MEIDSIIKSVSILENYLSIESKVTQLEKEILIKDEYIKSLENKLKVFTENSQLKSYISSLETKVKYLQQKIEELEIVANI
jgi:predicted RNase H-like nuclease (RuvC/YqgF family)